MKHLALALSASLLVAGCSQEAGQNEQAGSLIGAGGGALFGGLLGNTLSHGSAVGTVLGVGLGAGAGYLVGDAIGRQLDQRDREAAQRATVAALSAPPNKPPVRWHSDHTSNSGTAVVQHVQKTSTGECRTVREVAYIKGEEVTQDQKYCRGTDGEWTSA